MQELLIESISTTDGIQSRTRTDAAYVTELAEILKSGKRLPPIDVYSDGGTTRAADGFHRILAHVEAGKKSIRCNVHKGGLKEAALASCAANQAHGLKRTNEDKRKAVTMALQYMGSMSDQAIADHVGVSGEMVRQMRRQLPTVGSCERTGTDGKTYPARRIPPPPASPTTCSQLQVDPPEIPANRNIPPPPVQTRTPPPPPAPKPAERVDEVGQKIPDHLVPLFDRAGEVQALLTAISRVRGVLSDARDSGDPLYAEVSQTADAGLQSAYDAIKATTPYAVCPWCHGTLSDQCRGCGHRGVIGKYRYDTTVPKELKA